MRGEGARLSIRSLPNLGMKHMDGKKFSYPMTILESHLDTFGHVNNATYLVLFEQARWEFITQNNFGLDQIQQQGLGPTILEIKLTFLKELTLRDTITIESKMLNYGTKVGTMSQSIMRDGDLCAQAEIVFGLFDLSKRKLIPPTNEWLVAIGLAP